MLCHACCLDSCSAQHAIMAVGFRMHHGSQMLIFSSAEMENHLHMAGKAAHLQQQQQQQQQAAPN